MRSGPPRFTDLACRLQHGILRAERCITVPVLLKLRTSVHWWVEWSMHLRAGWSLRSSLRSQLRGSLQGGSLTPRATSFGWRLVTCLVLSCDRISGVGIEDMCSLRIRFVAALHGLPLCRHGLGAGDDDRATWGCLVNGYDVTNQPRLRGRFQCCQLRKIKPRIVPVAGGR